MDGVRWLARDPDGSERPCCRCAAAGCPWDRVAGGPLCSDCQDLLALGVGEPLVEPLKAGACACCGRPRVVRFQTDPLQASASIEIELCPEHFRDLLCRRLDLTALTELGRRLRRLGIEPRQVFLLHEAFYDETGQALQPVPELS